MIATLRMIAAHMALVREHLFRDDHDEHAAVLLVGSRRDGRRATLLARELHLLHDEDFPPGNHGYRQIAPAALARLGNRAHVEGLGLVTLHSHPRARREVALSDDDLEGHRRVFAHLQDIVGGRPVAGIALGAGSADGEVWWSPREIHRLDRVDVVGERTETLRRRPPPLASASAERYDRQVRLFGARGQEVLRGMTVAVVGVGGGGSLVVEQLAHLGVGEIMVVDFDRVAEHNLSRIVGATARDARRGTKKVEVARRLVRGIDPSVRVTALDGDIVDREVADRLTWVDFIVLATDSHLSRLVVNAIAQAHLIPAVQIGAKVDVRSDGSIEQIYCAVRPILPPEGCLHCAGAIDQKALHRETVTSEERAAQDYLGEESGVVDPSVITLNAASAATAMNMFLLTSVGLGQEGIGCHRIHTPADAGWLKLQVERDHTCPWCSPAPHSQFARGENAKLPLRLSSLTPLKARTGRPRRAWHRLRPR